MKQLFEKFLKRECSEEEIQQIIDSLKKEKNLSYIPTIDEIYELIQTYPEIGDQEANRIYNNIVRNNNKIKPPVVKRLYPFLKYAVAVLLIGVITTVYYFKNQSIDLALESTTTFANNDIKPGENQAILTLADGSTVKLEKGKSYQDTKTNSDGSKIVYDKSNTNSFKAEYNYLTIPRGGEFLIKLSDGTQVWLNSESKLKYPTSFRKGETRKVELVYGEAYFDVSPSTKHNGANFIVYNQNQEIEVLGTEFNVKAYKGDSNIYTTLVEGKVMVSSDGEKRELKPSEQSNLDAVENEFLSVSTVNVYNEVSWKEGVFSFRKKSLEEITKVLSRWYNVEFSFVKTDLKKKGFNGVLGKDQNLEQILESFKNLGAIKNYKIINNTIILK